MKIAGNECFFWLGPNPSVILMDSELIKEVLNKSYVYLKPELPNPLMKLLAQGVLSEEKEKWAKHRKIINPAFHIDKLKVVIIIIIIFYCIIHCGIKCD